MDAFLFNQNGVTLEEFVEVYLHFYHVEDWEEDYLKYQFWKGLDDPLAQILLLKDTTLPFREFMDRALWVCGSSLTVALVDPEPANPVLEPSSSPVPSGSKPSSQAQLSKEPFDSPVGQEPASVCPVNQKPETAHSDCPAETAHSDYPAETALGEYPSKPSSSPVPSVLKPSPPVQPGPKPSPPVQPGMKSSSPVQPGPDLFCSRHHLCI